jgi:hypothetical protein
MVLRAIASNESSDAISAAALFRIDTACVESAFSGSLAVTFTAALVAWRGTSTNAINAAMNTRPPTIPITANRRDAFLDRADIHQ